MYQSRFRTYLAISAVVLLVMASVSIVTVEDVSYGSGGGNGGGDGSGGGSGEGKGGGDGSGGGSGGGDGNGTGGGGDETNYTGPFTHAGLIIQMYKNGAGYAYAFDLYDTASRTNIHILLPASPGFWESEQNPSSVIFMGNHVEVYGKVGSKSGEKEAFRITGSATGKVIEIRDEEGNPAW